MPARRSQQDGEPRLATDGAGNQTTATHMFHFFSGDPLFTTLSLSPSTSSILFGGALDVSMKLTDPANLGTDLTESAILLDVTDPDGGIVELGPFPSNANGQVTVTGLGREGNELLGPGEDLLFTKKGTWTLRARFPGTLRLAESMSSVEILLVGTSAGGSSTRDSPGASRSSRRSSTFCKPSNDS